MCRNIRNLSGVEYMSYWMGIAEFLITDYENWWFTRDYSDEPTGLHSYEMLRPFIRQVYEGFALLTGMATPSGNMDEDYAYNNLPYLLNAYVEAECPEDWAYRLYVAFDGPSDVRAVPQWHCVPSRKFTINCTEDMFDNDYESDEYIGISSRQSKIIRTRMAFV